VLPNYHNETKQWYSLLTPVIDSFIQSFKSSDSSEIKEFWSNSCRQIGHGSECEYLSGWLTSFCFWDENGKRISSLSIEETWAIGKEQNRPFTWGGVNFPIITPKSIPSALVEMPIKVQDSDMKIIYHATIIAGFVGMELKKEATCVQAASGWLMLENTSYPTLPWFGFDDEDFDDCAFSMKVKVLEAMELESQLTIVE